MQKSATSGLVRTWRDWTAEADISLHDVLIAFKRDVTTHHVVEQHSEWPHRRWNGTVAALSDPLWRAVHASTCIPRNNTLMQHPSYRNKKHIILKTKLSTSFSKNDSSTSGLGKQVSRNNDAMITYYYTRSRHVSVLPGILLLTYVASGHTLMSLYDVT